jgi:hypothetical protein
MKTALAIIISFVFAQSGVKVEHSGTFPHGSCGSHRDCPDSLCCSEWGYCGSTDEYCGKGCQPLYGNCSNVSKTQCGPAFNYQVCDKGLACSKYGWCGSSDDFTGSGCEQKYSSIRCQSTETTKKTGSEKSTDATKKEEPKKEEPKKEEPKKEEPKKEDPKTEEPKKEDPKTEEPKKEDPPAPAPQPNPPVSGGGGRRGRLTWYEFKGVGGMCEGIAYPDEAMVCAMHTDIRECGRTIRITIPSGRSVNCRVVDECDKNHGCLPGTIDGTRGVWGALGVDLGVGVVNDISWEFVN